MLFNSINFLIFIFFVLIFYYCINDKYRYFVLLIASYIFYGINNSSYLFLLFVITLLSYFSGYVLYNTKEEKDKKRVIFFNTFFSILILVYFKYFNIIMSSISEVFNGQFSIGKIIVPLGISFFILQAITYPIDLYRNQVKYEKNIFKFSLFISFFPQIMSGPISKSKEMLSQINDTHKYNKENLYYGFMMILYGYFQKMVIADTIAIGVNNVYDNLYNYTGIPLLLTVLLYSFQIYFDFSSYSKIAVGCAKLFGYELNINFNRPYFSESMKDFWSRWHISLSTWFKEYLYIPLGGNRKGNLKTYFNLIIVFLVSGLWHGTNYTYIIWGLLHGIYQVFERIINKKSKFKIINVIVTFLLVTFAWIFFRSNTLSDAIYIIKNIFVIDFINIKDQIFTIGFDSYQWLVLLVSLSLVIIYEYFYINKSFLKFLYKKSNLLKYLIIILLAFSIIIFGCYGPGYDSSVFIYLEY